MTPDSGASRHARRTASAAVLCFGLALAACASVERERDVGADAVQPGVVGTDAGAPPPVAGYDWFLDMDGSEAKLSFGMADSDDLALALTCAPGTGRLTLTRIAPAGATDIHLESGGDTERFDAVGEASPQGDGVFLTAQADPNTPVFKRFRRLGWLAVWQDGQRETLVPQPDSKASVERFFGLCG